MLSFFFSSFKKWGSCTEMLQNRAGGGLAWSKKTVNERGADATMERQTSEVNLIRWAHFQLACLLTPQSYGLFNYFLRWDVLSLTVHSAECCEAVEDTRTPAQPCSGEQFGGSARCCASTINTTEVLLKGMDCVYIFISSFIHTLMAAGQSAGRTIRSNLGFSILLKDTSTCVQKSQGGKWMSSSTRWASATLLRWKLCLSFGATSPR